MSQDTHRCDFCTGAVRPMVTNHEPVRLSGTVVILEGLIIGKCDRCGHRYYPADVIKRAEAAARNPEHASRRGTFPIVAA
jgi:YgiT-type zinc finger domain-containing protein